jgi:L-arabinokinase
MDQVSSCAGQQGALLRMVCQPHELKDPLYLPEGIRALGINSNVKHSVGGGMYGKTRCAAFMGHKIILDAMAMSGVIPSADLVHDPLKGYLANLGAARYDSEFRQILPEQILGRDFIAEHVQTLDTATKVEADLQYHVRVATDHHVYEAGRVNQFAELLEHAGRLPAIAAKRTKALRDAGELMYGSHESYTKNAQLGADECDLLVSLVRANESAGLYGAKITGGGSGGTVAVLADDTPEADAAVSRIMEQYQQKTGHTPEAFLASSPGAWAVGTEVHT